MVRVIGKDGKTCFDANMGVGFECSDRSDECPDLCVVDDGLTAKVYSTHENLRESARELIARGAKVSEGNEFGGHLFLDTPKGQREIYAPNADFSGHYLRSTTDIS